MLTTFNLCTGYTWTSLGSTPWLVRMQPDHATDTIPPFMRHRKVSGAIKLELLAVGKPLADRSYVRQVQQIDHGVRRSHPLGAAVARSYPHVGASDGGGEGWRSSPWWA